MTPANVITPVGPRWADPLEIDGHLNMLRNGIGTSGRVFDRLGWTFRDAADLFEI